MDLTRRLRSLPLVTAAAILTASTAMGFAKPVESKPAAPAHQKAEIDGRSMSYLVRGRGAPTVVIEPGMALPAIESDEWTKVRDEVAKKCRVFVYDRAGLGSSDPSPTRPRTSRDIAEDLHALLKKVKVPGPYVLVGHSIGGLNVRVFADLYPDDVAGVVLVDATHPDQETKWIAALGEESPDEPEAAKKAREFLTARVANPAANPEGFDIVASGEQVRSAKPLGDKPLAILTHSPDWKMVPGLPDDVSNKLEQVNQELQAGYVDLSTNSSHKVAKKAGHGIHVDDPRLVTAAILEVVEKTKSAASKNAKSAVSK